MDELKRMLSELDENVDRNRTEVHALTAELVQGHKILVRKRLWIIITFCSILLDIALTTGLGLLTANQVSVSKKIHNSQLTACAIGNQNKHNQIVIWSTVLKLPMVQSTDPAKIKAQKDLFNLVKNTNKPINCTKLYGK